MLLEELMGSNPIPILSEKTFWMSNNNSLINPEEPCSVDIYCERKDGWYALTLMPGSRSFYFPYKTGGNAGYIGIPDRCRDGTVAITGAMNGCALEVRYSQSRECYTFYHDANGRNMPPARYVDDRTVCRITAKHYWKDEFDRIATARGLLATIQFICVYHSYKWHVGCSAVLLECRKEGVAIMRYYVKDILEPEGGRYKGYFDATNHLILI